jgi:hypothetical protein
MGAITASSFMAAAIKAAHIIVYSYQGSSYHGINNHWSSNHNRLAAVMQGV